MCNASPHLPDEDPKYTKIFCGTPFHALMMGINNYEKYKHGNRDSYEKHLKILQHIKRVNPLVKGLHKDASNQ